ncbi:bifunctional D-glycero-beta-D-manno-heptose-7-phosphate kinase/D-glycero-beta-D-manno-heptose 1-phosphate adenylyltransferase HldE [Catenovulum sp. SM1970]|uniref:bifunctional D-glycero-beta-D-manno-heptose-7-phosphate kinase/D-glycero-beta-D-manno-heptose 1-phosphate adenylyltransferase HldE n=1 Tax=Marinifaba aquimaris TaxID=2741323 RepID=UPI001574AE15|nr:bifunctional D-glycero-beta-D-manno-heptose-7-phosphate kinase/D-glycero-beta-D-manno-heptose 1-phosphate adenylyltransferase HldE [Marinifaba aquimaris]NTS75716.1 bifunctional D-glycero-beta-D-manno-heptose-7-phosphate kinase/D-glycero-beta-D-manno-heptose 1-phosphate adenylyltransferase HldE [Marinifaba aquimaris]
MDFSLFQRFSQANILVVGDVMLDRYWQGDTSRISPEAPVPVVKVHQMDDKVGGAANVARNIAHLDGKVALLGIIGDDTNGDELEKQLNSEKISSVLVRQSEQPTITKLRVISRHQQVVRLDFEQTFNQASAQQLTEKFNAVVDDYDCIVFSDYNKGSLANITEMIAMAKAKGKLTLVDPKSSDLTTYAGANYITPNLKEFIDAGGKTTTEVEIEQSVRQLLSDANIDNMLLTRSEQGMSLVTADAKYDLAAQVLEVNDVTGAGDTVIATLACCLAINASAKDAALLANLAAGIVVGKLGAACVTPEELMARLNQTEFKPDTHYQCPFEDVLQHIEFARQSGEKIVFTNGCFDILHAGHVRYLEKAKALGDKLVLGLNNDASISRLKGPERPINPLDERASVMTALAAVDWVIPFGEAGDDTPLELIKAVKPDVLVKGGDYTIETIVGADFVLESGGAVRTIDFVDGCSTTKIIEKIQS